MGRQTEFNLHLDKAFDFANKLGLFDSKDERKTSQLLQRMVEAEKVGYDPTKQPLVDQKSFFKYSKSPWEQILEFLPKFIGGGKKEDEYIVPLKTRKKVEGMPEIPKPFTQEELQDPIKHPWVGKMKRHGGEGFKGEGYYGVLPGLKGDMSEFTTDYQHPRTGKMIEIPTMVPGLTYAQLSKILSSEVDEGIVKIARDWAGKRIELGMSPFAREGEFGKTPLPTPPIPQKVSNEQYFLDPTTPKASKKALDEMESIRSVINNLFPSHTQEQKDELLKYNLGFLGTIPPEEKRETLKATDEYNKLVKKYPTYTPSQIFKLMSPTLQPIAMKALGPILKLEEGEKKEETHSKEVEEARLEKKREFTIRMEELRRNHQDNLEMRKLFYSLAIDKQKSKEGEELKKSIEKTNTLSRKLVSNLYKDMNDSFKLFQAQPEGRGKTLNDFWANNLWSKWYRQSWAELTGNPERLIGEGFPSMQTTLKLMGISDSGTTTRTPPIPKKVEGDGQKVKKISDEEVKKVLKENNLPITDANMKEARRQMSGGK